MSDEEEEENVRDEKEESETMDIYNEEQLEEMLENDEITESEYSFMQGREKIRKKKKLGLERKGHDDSISDELVKDEYQED